MRRSYAACAATALSAISVRAVALGTSSCLQKNLNLSDSVLPADHAAGRGFQFKLEKLIPSTKLALPPRIGFRTAHTELLTILRNGHWYIRRTTSSACCPHVAFAPSGLVPPRECEAWPYPRRAGPEGS